MELTFSETHHVGQIVAEYPGAAKLFKRHGIDFCCGGGKPVGQVLDQNGIAADSFLQELNAAYQAYVNRGKGDKDWRAVPLSGLVEHIVKAHHGFLRQGLPVLSNFVTKVARVHGGRHPELIALYHTFHRLRNELEGHMASEEQDLFPLILAYEKTGARADLERALQTLEELEAEHEAAGSLLAAIRSATSGFQLPADACRTYTATYHELAELESDMFTHVHLENNILFPRLRQAAQERA